MLRSAPSAVAARTACWRPAGSRGHHQDREGVVIEGDVKGGEDLVIDGTIELRHHVLTVGPTGRVKVQLSAKSVVADGAHVQSIRASERVSIGETGSVEGAISAPRLVVADGAHVQGRVDEACFLRYSQGDALDGHSLNTAKGTRLGVFIQGLRSSWADIRGSAVFRVRTRASDHRARRVRQETQENSDEHHGTNSKVAEGR